METISLNPIINNKLEKEMSNMSIDQIFFYVSQVVSMCRSNAKSADVTELSQCLPLFQIILSDLSEIVAFTQQQQHDASLMSDSAYNPPSYSDASISSSVSSHQRALNNLPKPQDIPLHGCSQDEGLYNQWHNTNFPFGSMPGFRTNLGIISLDTIKEPVHGFVYDHDYGGWVIHASYKKDVFNRKDVIFNRKQGQKKLLKFKKTGSTPLI